MTPKGIVGPVGTIQGTGGAYSDGSEHQTVSFTADPQRPALVKVMCQVAVNLGTASTFTLRLKRDGTTIATVTGPSVAQYSTPSQLTLEVMGSETISRTYTATIQANTSSSYQHAVSQITIL